MTVSNSTVSQVSQLQFERTGMYTIESREGYSVNIHKCAGVWVYCASGPKREVVRVKRIPVAVIDPLKGQIDFKVRYNIGDEMPLSHESLGCYREDEFGGTDAAKAAAINACNEHHALVLQAQQRGENTSNSAGPSHSNSLRARNTAKFG